MSNDSVIVEAEFDPKVCSYWLVSVSIVFIITLFGIPLLLLWIPFGLLVTKKYFRSIYCVLTKRSLIVRKGVWVKTEKTIPLEKITDMGMVQGPIMRFFDLHLITVETAGQSGPGSLVTLTGIVDVESFRTRVLSQRDKVMSTSAETDQPESEGNVDESLVLLREFRDILLRIESKLDRTKD